MADNYQYYHVTSASFAMTIEQMYDNHPNQRLLQNFNSTPENDREAGFISVGLLTGVILLSLSLFLCNALVSKFWYASLADLFVEVAILLQHADVTFAQIDLKFN